MAKISKLLVNNILLICGRSDNVFKGQLDVALGLKKDLPTQIESATTSKEIDEILSSLPAEDSRFYGLKNQALKKHAQFEARELSDALKNLPKTSDAYSKVLGEYSRQTPGYEEAEKELKKMLSEELENELEKADTPEKCFDIEDKAEKAYLYETKKKAGDKGDVFLFPELEKATMKLQCQEIWRKGSWNGELRKRADKKEKVLALEEFNIELEKADTAKACEKIRDTAPRDSEVWKKAVKKYEEFRSQELLAELAKATTSKQCLELRGHANWLGDVQRQIDGKYNRLLAEELFAELQSAVTLHTRLLLLDRATKESGVQEKIWEKVFELFITPEQLPACLRRTEPYSPEECAVIKKAAQMLQEQEGETSETL